MENGTTPQTAAAIFRETYPLDFELYDENDQPVLYIVDDATGHNLALVIRNTSTLMLTLTPPEANNNMAAADNFHFELRFRPGTLSSATLDQLSIAEANWSWQRVQQADDTDSIYLLYTAALPALAPDASLTLTLQNISAAAGGGARGSRVELRYQQLTTNAGEAVNGNRLQHVSIVNARGRRNIPLHVGFAGSNMILNNNTANSLALRITNALRSSAFTFNPETRLVLAFDADDTPDRSLEYALGTSAEVAAIGLEAPGWLVDPPSAEAESPEWLLTPEAGSVTLEPGQHLQVYLTGIITSHPNGHTNVYLHYENVSGYADGQFIAGIEKTPLVYREGNVGIGATNPRRQLHIVDNSGLDNGIVIDSGDSADSGNLRFISSTNHWNIDNAAGRLRFFTETDYNTGGSEKVAILPNGRLGIGATTPRYPLAIRAQEPQEGLISFENPAGQTKWHLEQNFGGNRPGLNFVETGVADGRLFIGAGGNVGVGTTQPETALHIRGGSDPTLKIQSDGTDEFSGRVSLRQSNNTGADIFYDGRNSHEGLRFHVFSFDSSPTLNLLEPSPLFISNQNANYGNIGIRTTNPRAALDVHGDINIRGDKPIIFRRFNNLGDNINFNTGFSANDYSAAVIGFRALNGDIQEGGAGDIIQVYMHIVSNQWFIRADFRSHNTPETWYIDVMFVRNELVSRIGY